MIYSPVPFIAAARFTEPRQSSGSLVWKLFSLRLSGCLNRALDTRRIRAFSKDAAFSSSGGFVAHNERRMLISAYKIGFQAQDALVIGAAHLNKIQACGPKGSKVASLFEKIFTL